MEHALLINWLSCLVYTGSAVSYVAHSWKRKPIFGTVATYLLVLGVLVNLAALIERSYWTGSVPYHGFDGAASLASWYLAIIILGLERTHAQKTMSVLLAPLVAAGQWLATLSTTMGQFTSDEARRGWLFALHVNASMFAYVAFTVSFIASALYLIQNHILRSRRPGALFGRLPSLQLLERVNGTSVGIGLLIMAVGFVTGAVWGMRVWTESTGGPDAKIWWSLLSMVVYAAYLLLRQRRGWRGPRSTWIAVAGFVTIILSLTVVNIFLSELHSFF